MIFAMTPAMTPAITPAITPVVLRAHHAAIIAAPAQIFGLISGITTLLVPGLIPLLVPGRIRFLAALIIMVMLSFGLAGPGYGFGVSSGERDPDIVLGDEAVMEKRYEDALKAYGKAIESDPENADAWSQTGFTLRRLNRLPEALEAYESALAIDPFHLGANEYLGELYLRTGAVEMAEEMAAVLKRACPDGCEELATLRRAIDEYRATGGQVTWDK